MRHLIIKELLQLVRNSFMPRLILVFPVVMICVLPLVMDMDVKGVNVVVVDHDNSDLSRRLIQRIEALDRFELVGLCPTYGEAMGKIEDCTADLIVEVPQDYQKDVARGSMSPILVAANAVNGTKGSMGASYVSSVISQNLPLAATSQQGGETFSTLYLYNNHLDYKRYMIPALFTMLVMMLCGFLPALNIVGEKESGTIEQINVTPVSRFTFILSKLIPYWAIAMLVLTVCLLLSKLVYGIVPAGNIALIYLISLLLALVFSGLGLVVSNYSDTMQQAIFVMWFFVMCMMLLSGLFTPISSMPNWAQAMTRLFPASYFIDAIRTIFIRGGTFTDIIPQTSCLLGFALFFDLWAVISYRKKD